MCGKKTTDKLRNTHSLTGILVLFNFSKWKTKRRMKIVDKDNARYFFQIISPDGKIHVYKPCTRKREVNPSAKSIEPCQLAQFAQADMDRYFSLFNNSSHFKGPVHLMLQSAVM